MEGVRMSFESLRVGKREHKREGQLKKRTNNTKKQDGGLRVRKRANRRRTGDQTRINEEMEAGNPVKMETGRNENRKVEAWRHRGHNEGMDE